MVFPFFNKYSKNLDVHKNFIEAISDKNYMNKIKDDEDEMKFINVTINQIIPIIETIILKNKKIENKNNLEEIENIVILIKKTENINKRISYFLTAIKDIKKYNFSDSEIFWRKFEQLMLKAANKIGF